MSKLQSGSLSRPTIDSSLFWFSIWNYPHSSSDKFFIENLDDLGVYLVHSTTVSCGQLACPALTNYFCVERTMHIIVHSEALFFHHQKCSRD